MIDREKLKIKYAGDTDLIDELISIVEKEVQLHFPKLIEALQSADSEQIRFFSHKIKGSANTVSADEFVPYLQSIEDGQVDASDIEKLQTLYEKFLQSLRASQ